MASFRAGPVKVARTAVIAAVMLSFLVILLIDLYLVPWRIAIPILFAIPVIIAARFLSAMEAAAILMVAIVADLARAWLDKNVDTGTYVLGSLSLLTIGVLAILWARSERSLARLAQENEALYRDQLARAQELEESRSRLQESFNIVAHDLRSPLTAVMGNAQLLARWNRLDQDARARITESILRESKRIKRLADDLADAAQLGTGRLSIERSECDLVKLVEGVVSQQQMTTTIHELAVQTPSDPVVGRWDCDRVAQVLSNLASNAIKYSPEGGEVRVRVERRDCEALVSVSDQGVGIPPEDIALLFVPYSRVYRKAGIRGTGLGLYISKGIVEAHGGRIQVDSRVGEGSTFTVVLPLF